MSDTNYDNHNTSIEQIRGDLKTSIKHLNKLLCEMDNVIDIWANTRADIAQVVDSTTKNMPIEEVDV